MCALREPKHQLASRHSEVACALLDKFPLRQSLLPYLKAVNTPSSYNDALDLLIHSNRMQGGSLDIPTLLEREPVSDALLTALDGALARSEVCPGRVKS